MTDSWFLVRNLEYIYPNLWFKTIQKFLIAELTSQKQQLNQQLNQQLQLDQQLSQ